jgi:hypothetical protein
MAEVRRIDSYIAINTYRTSTSDGFANTWVVYRTIRKRQRELLRNGAPVKDQCLLAEDGRRLPYHSTNGIRLATRAEIRRYKRDNPTPADVYTFL